MMLIMMRYDLSLEERVIDICLYFKEKLKFLDNFELYSLKIDIINARPVYSLCERLGFD